MKTDEEKEAAEAEQEKERNERRKRRKRCQDAALHIPAIDVFTAEQEPQLGVDLAQEQTGL